MSFKEIVQNDNLNVFVDVETFGEDVLIDGKEVSVVFDDDELKKQKLKQGEGVHEDERLFYVRKDEMPFYPRPEQRFDLNGDLYDIKGVNYDTGIFTITIRVSAS